MKKLILTTLAVCAVAITSIFANAKPFDEIIVNLEQVEAKTIKLLVANLEKESTKITIEDQEGTIYFSNFVNNHNGYSKKINLEKLPKGKYMLKIKKEDQKVIYVVVIKEDKLMISQPSTIK